MGESRKIASITAKMRYLISGRDSPRREGVADCICCEGPHIFSRFLETEGYQPSKKRNKRIDDWLYENVMPHLSEGDRIRLEVHIVAEEPNND